MDNQWKYAGIAGASILLTLAGAGVARVATDKGLGPLTQADANGDGLITQGEWVTAANARFAALDANRDGKLVVGEVPPPRAHHRHGRGHRDDRYDEDDRDEDEGAMPIVSTAPQATSREAAAPR